MSTIQLKTSTSIRIDSAILSQIKSEAKAENRSLSNYIETLLYRMGYRPYNEETVRAYEEARRGECVDMVDTGSIESIEASLFADEA